MHSRTARWRKRIPVMVPIVVFLSLAVGVALHAAPNESAAILRAQFKPDGTVLLPVGYRGWVHVGTKINAQGGFNILDSQPAKTPEVLEAYIEPRALAVYKKTGNWPDGTQMVKEFSALDVGPECDSTTHECAKDIGHGMFQTNYVGLGMMVKDVARFPKDPGHWGFFQFGHKPPPYAASSPPQSFAQCAGCHVALGPKTDFVIVRAHIGLAPSALQE